MIFYFVPSTCQLVFYCKKELYLLNYLCVCLLSLGIPEFWFYSIGYSDGPRFSQWKFLQADTCVLLCVPRTFLFSCTINVVSSPRAFLGQALESDASPDTLAVSILQPCTSLLGTHLVPRPHAVPDMLLSKRQFNSLVLLKVTAMAFLKHWNPASILKGLWQFQYMLHNKECLEVQPQDMLGHRFKWASLLIINPAIYKPEIFLKLLEFIHYTRYSLI